MLRIPRLQSGGIIATYHCPSSCGHCLYRCGPRRERRYVGGDAARRVARRILEGGCRSVHIGGGEPFVDEDGLVGLAEIAGELGLGIDYVETNSAWYAGPEAADRTLTRLLAAGVDTLLVSISPFHNAHVPFAKVKGVLAACRRTGMGVFPWVMDFFRDLDALPDGETHSLAEQERVHGAGYLRRMPARYWIHLGGRALRTFGRVLPRSGVEALLAHHPGGCRELAQTDHFHVDLDGRYVPGLCAGLAIAMEDLGAPLPADRYPILTRLADAGIGSLYCWARETHGFEASAEGYVSKCDLCDALRRHLVHHAGLDSPELAPRGFYGTGTEEPAGGGVADEPET